MSTISSNILNNWIINKVGSELTSKEAQSLGVEDEFTEAAEELDVREIDIDDFSDDLLAEFAVLYVEEQDAKNEAKDEEKEKEEQTQVKDKNGAGV